LGYAKTDSQSGLRYVEVTYFLPLRFLERHATRLTYTPDAWTYGNKILDILKELTSDPNLTIVGWPHSHPGYGSFLSGHDAQVNRHWSQDDNLAIVIDPRQETDLTPEIAVFSRLGKGPPEEYDPQYKKHTLKSAKYPVTTLLQ